MHKPSTYPIILFLLSFLSTAWQPLCGQNPFTCEGQVFVLSSLSTELADLGISPANNALSFTPISANLGQTLNALGFRSTDRLLYGIGQADQHLYRIDADGTLEDMGALSLNPNLQYLAGDISPNGRFLTVVGSANGASQSLVRIDLEDPGLNVQTSSISSALRIPDMAYNPLNGLLYAYDANGRTALTINPANGAVTALAMAIGAQNDIQGLFFDPFGRLFGYGTTSFGVASALFAIDKSTGQEVVRQTGPVYPITDMASCPYSVALESRVEPKATFPCSQVSYVYTLGNSTGVLTGLSLEHALPPGFSFVSLVRNPYGGTISAPAPSNTFRLENMSAPKGMDSIIITVEIGDISGGSYKSQALLDGLPPSLGIARPSDDPATLAAQDSTGVVVNRIEEDSLFFDRFLCLGESTTLDAGGFGNNIQWENGSAFPQRVVSTEGLYTLEAISGCQSIFVSYNITVASCPYTIELALQILPEETFPCNEVIFRYGIENDSGLPRTGVSLADTLPDGMTVVGVLSNPFGGGLAPGLPAGVLRMEGMTLPLGTDSVDIVVAIGDVLPGVYRNRSVLGMLPAALGQARFSDDPRTPLVDSTTLTVFGVESDTVFVEQLICNGQPLVLDGRLYGASYLWEDGSTGPHLTVSSAGEYQLAVFDGCQPSFVFFTVVEGDFIEARFPDEKVNIHLGEEYRIEPILANSGDTLIIGWNDPLGNSLSCTDCLTPTAKPLDHTLYTLSVSNGLCADTARLTFLVDKSRRIYAPTAFSPNGDGRNDYFFLQSPDFGNLRSLSVFDRWGNQVFHSTEAALNEASGGWNGQVRGKPAAAGLYLWKAEIEFIGEIREVFAREVNLVR